MGDLIIALVSGLCLGGTYALLSMGIVLVFRGTGIFNLCHGELLLLAAYLVATIAGHHVSLGLAALIGVATLAAVSMIIYRLGLYRTTGQPSFIGLIATLGIATVLDNVMNLAWGSGQYEISAGWLPSGSVHMAGAGVSELDISVAVIALVLCGLVVLWLQFTSIGIRMRAAGSNALLASQSGINVRRYYLGVWAVAGGLAAAAGVLYGSTVLITPSLSGLGLLALPAVMLGGLDSVVGAMVGGVLIGILQACVTTYWNGTVLDVVTYGVLLLILLIRPEGILGSREAVRV